MLRVSSPPRNSRSAWNSRLDARSRCTAVPPSRLREKSRMASSRTADTLGMTSMAWSSRCSPPIHTRPSGPRQRRCRARTTVRPRRRGAIAKLAPSAVEVLSRDGATSTSASVSMARSTTIDRLAVGKVMMISPATPPASSRGGITTRTARARRVGASTASSARAAPTRAIQGSANLHQPDPSSTAATTDTGAPATMRPTPRHVG